MSKSLRVLAVGDPAVYVYVDRNNDFLALFQEETGIQVDFEIIKWADYYGTLLNSFQEYQYDIVMVAGHLWLKEFVSKGYLLELKGEFTEDYDYPDIMPSIRKEIELNGKRYLYPSFCDGHILLYRKSHLNQELGRVVSIAELIQVVSNNADGKNDTFVIKAHPSEIFLDFLPYLRDEGIDAFDDQGLPLFNTNAGYTALEKYIGMKQYCAENVAEFGNEEVREALQRVQCKLGVTWGGQLGQIMNEQCLEPEDIGFASLETSWNTTWSFGINHLCQDQENAEMFLQYITSKEIDKVVGAYCGNPTRRSSFIAGQEEYRWYPVLLNMLEQAKPLPHLINTGQLIGIVTEEIVKAFKGEISPKEALDRAYHKIVELN